MDLQNFHKKSENILFIKSYKITSDMNYSSFLPKLFLIVIITSFIITVENAQCHGSPGQKKVNSHPIWKGQPKFLRKHKYGKLSQIGTNDTTVKLLHVYGDMYQMGLAHGELLKQQIQQMSEQIWEYLKAQFIDDLPKKIPKFLQKSAAGLFLETALDITYEITKPYTNRKYYTQMRAIAEGSEVPFKKLRRIHMIGQLTKGTCSMFGAWGKATTDGKVIQLRSLDWDIDGPFRKYPMVVVYHPSSPKFGTTWLNVGFCGWIGVLSGVNSHRLGISQIGVYFNDETFGKESRFGNPFTFVMRDVLQWDKTLNQSINRLKNTKRTCNLILGVGDGNSNQFRGFQYSHSVLNVVNDTVLLPLNSTWHPPLEQVVYYGMDWLCPNYHKRLYEMLQQFYGEITVQNTIEYIVPGLNSGNLQAVVYDLANEWIYFSYGTKINNKVVNAYERPYLALDLKKMFNQTLNETISL